MPSFGQIRFSGDRFFFYAHVSEGIGGLTYSQSFNGIAWNLAPGPGSGIFSLPAAGNGIFLAVGAIGQCGVSTNGRDWAIVQTGTTNNLLEIEFGGGRFTAVGELGTILTSTNGTNWDPITTDTDTRLSTVAWNNGRWVASGSDASTTPPRSEEDSPLHPLGVVLHSADGIVWESVLTNGFARIVPFKGGFFSEKNHLSLDGRSWWIPSGNYRGVEGWPPILGSSGDQLMAASYYDTPINLYSSTDGTNWVRRIVPYRSATAEGSTYAYGGLAYGRGSWVVNHGSGALVQSDPVEPTRPSLIEQPQTVSGGPGQDAVLRTRALGSSPLLYQWFRNGQLMVGATNQFLMLLSTENLTNQFAVTVSNAFGSTQSDGVVITPPARPQLRIIRHGSDWLEIDGTSGRRYVTQETRALGSPTNWTVIGVTEIDADSPAYLPINRSLETNRFYRTRLEP